MQEGERAFEHFKTVQSSGGLEKAVYHKDKLLNFDQTRSPYCKSFNILWSLPIKIRAKCENLLPESSLVPQGY